MQASCRRQPGVNERLLYADSDDIWVYVPARHEQGNKVPVIDIGPLKEWFDNQVRAYLSGEVVDPVIKRYVNRLIWEMYAFKK